MIDQFLNRSLEDLDFKDKTLKFVQDRSDLLKLNISDTDFLLGWQAVQMITDLGLTFKIEFACIKCILHPRMETNPET